MLYGIRQEGQKSFAISDFTSPEEMQEFVNDLMDRMPKNTVLEVFSVTPIAKVYNDTQEVPETCPCGCGRKLK